jgi:hypothetical protein
MVSMAPAHADVQGSLDRGGQQGPTAIAAVAFPAHCISAWLSTALLLDSDVLFFA